MHTHQARSFRGMFPHIVGCSVLMVATLLLLFVTVNNSLYGEVRLYENIMWINYAELALAVYALLYATKVMWNIIMVGAGR